MKNLIWILILAILMLNMIFINHTLAKEEPAALCDSKGNAVCRNKGTLECPPDHPYLKCFGLFAACVDQLKGGTGVNPVCQAPTTSTTSTRTTTRR